MKVSMRYLMILAVLAIATPKMLTAQVESSIKMCQTHMDESYVSDGQYYTVLLNKEDIAEFYVTFYGGTIYRLVGYCGTDAGNLAFSVYDQDRNLLFTNRDFENTPYWDFKFENSMDCIIEAEIDAKDMDSGIAVMLIGFKQ